MIVPIVIVASCCAIAWGGLSALPIIASIRRQRYGLSILAALLCMLLPLGLGWSAMLLWPINSIADTFFAPLIGFAVMVLSAVFVPLLILACVSIEPEPENYHGSR